MDPAEDLGTLAAVTVVTAEVATVPPVEVLVLPPLVQAIVSGRGLDPRVAVAVLELVPLGGLKTPPISLTV